MTYFENHIAWIEESIESDLTGTKLSHIISSLRRAISSLSPVIPNAERDLPVVPRCQCEEIHQYVRDEFFNLVKFESSSINLHEAMSHVETMLP